MSEATTAGADTNEAGGTQGSTDTTQTTAVTGEQGTKPGDAGASQQTQGETKTEGQPAAEEVTFKAELPEGVELDQASLDEFTKIVKNRALKPSEQAQKLVDLAIKREADRAAAFAETVKGWADEVAADKELGNTENQAVARKIIDDLGTPELKSLLNSTGLGNHPEVVRFVMKVGKAMSEDAVVRARGDAPQGATKDPAYVLYDKTPKA